jgi:hypothetical protein
MRRLGAYHEAAHAVVDVIEGHTVRYVSLRTEGTDYQDICVTSVNHLNIPGVGLIPAPREALGHAIATIAGNMAMWREAGKTYPWDSWEKVLEECEQIEELDDPDQLDGDDIEIRKYCEAAALFGQRVKMPTADEVPDDALPLLPQPPKTGKVAFELALKQAKHRVDRYWPAIRNVAEKLRQVGYLRRGSRRDCMELLTFSEGEELSSKLPRLGAKDRV